jgi:hypothetical protein
MRRAETDDGYDGYDVVEGVKGAKGTRLSYVPYGNTSKRLTKKLAALCSCASRFTNVVRSTAISNSATEG